MNSSQVRRMWTVAIGMGVALGVIILRLFAFQVLHGDEWREVAIESLPVTDTPERGVIYDRNGAVLAVDEWDYRVGISPSILTDPEELANELAPVLQIPAANCWPTWSHPNSTAYWLRACRRRRPRLSAP